MKKSIASTIIEANWFGLATRLSGLDDVDFERFLYRHGRPGGTHVLTVKHPIRRAPEAHQPLIEALILRLALRLRPQMPFADIGRVIACRLEHRTERNVVRLQAAGRARHNDQ